MARGERDLRVNFLANVRDFLRGTRDAGRALEDLEQDFKDTDRASDNANRSMQDAARKTARTLDATAKDSGGRFKDAGGEIGSEFAQNIGEGISSGKANISGALDTVLGTAGGLVGSFGGPIGIAAGIGALITGGVVKGIIDSANAQKERLRQAGNNMYEALKDGVLDAVEREGFVTDALGKESYADALTEAIRLAKELGVQTYQVLDYIETGGKVAAPELAAALDTANSKAAEMQRIVGKGTLPAIDGTVDATNDLKAATDKANAALAYGVELASVEADRKRQSAYWQGILNARYSDYVRRMADLYATDPNNPAFTGRYPSARG